MIKLSKQKDLKDREGYLPDNKNQVGQDLIEFAALITIFLIIVMAIIEFSAFLYFLSTLNAASRNGVRFAIAENNLVDCSGIQAAVNNKIAPITGSFNDVTIKYDISGSISPCPPGNPQDISAGDEITVSVTSTYDPIISLFNFLQGSYTADSSRSILVNIQLSN